MKYEDTRPDKVEMRTIAGVGQCKYETYYDVWTIKLNQNKGWSRRDVRVIRSDFDKIFQVDVRPHWDDTDDRDIDAEKPEWYKLNDRNGEKLVDSGKRGHWHRSYPGGNPPVDAYTDNVNVVSDEFKPKQATEKQATEKLRHNRFVDGFDSDEFTYVPARFLGKREHMRRQEEQRRRLLDTTFTDVTINAGDGFPKRHFAFVTIRHDSVTGNIDRIITLRRKGAEWRTRPLDSGWQHWARRLLAAENTPPPNVEEEPTMKAELANTILALQAEQGIVKTIRVIFEDELITHLSAGKPIKDYQFEGMQEYTYKTHLMDLEVGDIVVVEARNGYNVCPVVGIDADVDLTSGKQLKWVVARLGDALKNLSITKRNEAEAANRLAKAKALQQALEAAKMAGVDLTSLKTLLLGQETKEQAEELSK